MDKSELVKALFKKMQFFASFNTNAAHASLEP
jgi:hypothetical protein